MISERPHLAELLAQFKREASRPPFQIGDAAAVAIAAAFDLGRRVGAEHAADRVGGVLRSLAFEATGNA